MKTFRKSKRFKLLACFIAVNLVVEIVSPTVAYALTAGPSQPESSAFEPAGTTQMVDMFSGDFTYNIPLFELPGPDGGYPFNLSYQSGITMEQEATWVGLGWNINPGAINRQVRGLPDEFKGDQVKVNQDVKALTTFGTSVGISVEIFGGDLSKAVNLNTSIYYNNYRGIGYGAGASFSMGSEARDGVQSSIGISFDSQNGIGGNVSLGYEMTTASLGFNSESGLSGSLNYSIYREEETRENGILVDSWEGTRGIGASLLGSATYAYSPQVGMEYQTIPLSISFKIGGGAGAYPNMSFGGFYNIQKLKETSYSRGAFGYFNLEDEGKGENSLLDFNREKQTLIHEKTPNLPIPSLTADYYNISGQGTGGMFRAWRSDYGSVFDPVAVSNTNGGSIGVDLGMPHWGIAGTYTQGKAKSGPWTEDNDMFDYHKFESPKSGSYEPAYFKVYGEKTATRKERFSEIGGNGAVRVEIESLGGSGKYKAKKAYKNVNNDSIPLIPAKAKTDETGFVFSGERFIRGQNIQQITNEWLLDENGDELLPEYNFQYYNSVSNQFSKSEYKDERATHESHHFAGMTVVNKGGSRYVYGLPAMNKKKVEALFSVVENTADCHVTTPLDVKDNKPFYQRSGTDEFFQHTETPEFAHSYLLTSILGPDYVDINDNGPDEADYGYWVKFTYTKAHDNYQWRSPYTDAGLDLGVISKFSDNKGFYNYGEKEIWYLATAETKSHVAVFNLDQNGRTDALSAAGELAKGTAKGTDKLYSLASITLYTRAAYDDAVEVSSFTGITALQTIEFEYNNSLCDEIDNGTTGKLTLEKVGFYFQNNKRGLLNKYHFTYSSSNPKYSEHTYDRWGGFKDNGNKCQNLQLPYVSQFDISSDQDSVAKYSHKTTMANSAQAWHLTEIVTPTKSKINIDYESDDYSYVQHREANQMFQIDGLHSKDQFIYDISASPSADDTEVYIKLEHPIPTSTPDAKQYFYDHYLRGLERKRGEDDTYVQLYFKNYTNLRDKVWEYVSGYVDMVPGGYNVDASRVKALDIEGDGVKTLVDCYTHAYVKLEEYHDSRSGRDYHPMAALAWQKMRSDHPELLTTPGNIEKPGTSAGDKAQQVLSLINLIPQVTKLFKGYLKHCFDKDWSRKIDLSRSVIRLCSPDQTKLGGGIRVKQISISDEFDEDGAADTYGQVYDYTTINEFGEVISSGVASYEPMLGGDENALKYAKTFTDKQSFKSDNQLYFEYPINESYYPGPSVGYSKVTVRSLATNKVLNEELSNEVATTGTVVHEFYTAKDFPTIASETGIAKVPYHLWIPIPLIGMITNDKLTATQGYSVELNDMHGKPKAIHYYPTSEDLSSNKAEAVSSVKYNYRSEDITYQDKSIKHLKNDVFTCTGDVIDSYLGVEYEFFVDHLQSKSYNITGGLDFNVEIPAFPLFLLWPGYSESKTQLKTIVVNKIIHRAGILEETIASDGRSTVTSTNLGFDAITGEPFLTKTENRFGDDIYQIKAGANGLYIAVPSNGSNYLGEPMNNLVPTRASYSHFGTLTTDVTVEKLDTTRVGEVTGGCALSNGCWHDDEKFGSFIKAQFGNYYVPTNGINNYSGFTPGAVLVFKDNAGNLYKGTALQITRGKHEVAEALYSKDPIPVSQNLTMFVIKPGEKNLIDNVLFQATSKGEPITTGLSEPILYRDGTSGNIEPYQNILQMSPITLLRHSKEIKDVVSPNPYASGERGIILPYKTYSYRAEREQSNPLQLENDGIYKDSLNGNFVYYPINDNLLLGTNEGTIAKHPWWQLNEHFTQYDNFGHQVESRNALNVYSSASYGHLGTSMVWRAVNAPKSQVYSIDFEDADFKLYTIGSSPVTPFADGHTGKKCLKQTSNNEYKLSIVPQDGKKYFLSTWVKANEETFDYSLSVNPNTRGIKVKFYNADYTTTRGESALLKPVGPIIEGWQKIEGTFEVSSTTADTVQALSVEILPGITTVGETSAYSEMMLDDLRIMPYNANMMTYVYDPATYRLRAILDENNYASLYYYDEDGKLFLVKKETEKGIYTLQETRSYQD